MERDEVSIIEQIDGVIEETTRDWVGHWAGRVYRHNPQDEAAEDLLYALHWEEPLPQGSLASFLVRRRIRMWATYYPDSGVLTMEALRISSDQVVRLRLRATSLQLAFLPI